MMILTADLETTTDPLDCRVWAWGLSEVGNPDYFRYGNDLGDFFEYMKKSENSVFYFHNLKFDGEFLINHLFKTGFTHVKNRKDIKTKTFTTLISDSGAFYSIKIYFKKSGHKSTTATIYDSSKIIPGSIRKMAETFKLPILKGDIDYHEYRAPGHSLTLDEINYLRNDVEIPARALAVLFAQGLNKMTVGSNALHDYKQELTEARFNRLFPPPDYDADVRKSYKGGFTWLNPKYKDIDIDDGIVLDVNSLYPSVMRNKPLPYGEGLPFKGKYKPDTLYPLYVQQLRCQFELKPKHIPTIQIKNSLQFVPTEYLESSKDKETGEDDEIILTLTSVDLELFHSHYKVYNIEYMGGWMFKSANGMFTKYVDRWNKIKMDSAKTKNAGMRALSKLMLNNLYGKFAINPNVQSKSPIMDLSGTVHYTLDDPELRKPLYIPVGTFITAWARWITITAAQSVYDRFVYADTDSLHLLGADLPDLEIDDYELGAFKLETIFSKARFIRSKQYLEFGYSYDPKDPEGLNAVDELKITCAGLPERCHPFVTWENFKSGSVFPGKLTPKHVPGGIVLQEIEFTLKL